ncbi:cell division protein ZapD [Burkholderiaceae bacterium]|nr:cell division protein ZapD [Burkholderiaceae bacterium]
MITYEYPINERVRTYLRVERLLNRLSTLQAGVEANDHHFALQTLFELMDIGSRADIRGDLLKDIDRQKGVLSGYAENPNINRKALDDLLVALDSAYKGVSGVVGKPGQALNESDFLMALRGRMGIPAGTCEFDLPAYHNWLHRDASRRRADLDGWMASFKPIQSALALCLGLLRDSSSPQSVVAKAGTYQQNLPHGRSIGLVRIELRGESDFVPEISANRLLLSVRIMQCDAHQKMQTVKTDVDFVISLCS